MARGKDKNKEQEQNKGATESMRLDKYLKVSRIIKRRTVAGEACDGGRVLINGKEGKPGAQIKVWAISWRFALARAAWFTRWSRCPNTCSSPTQTACTG